MKQDTSDTSKTDMVITQVDHNPFRNRQRCDRYELMVLHTDLSIHYRYCTSYRQLCDGRLLLLRTAEGKARCASNPKTAKVCVIMRVRDFLMYSTEGLRPGKEEL